MAYQQPFLRPLRPIDDVPLILFRVEHGGHEGRRVPSSFSQDENHNLVSRKRFRRDRFGETEVDWRDFNNHLSWKPVPTPFLSFTTSWNRASNLRDKRIRDGYEDVNIVAIWANEMANVYSARASVNHLGPNFRYAQNPGYFDNEYLVAWAVDADEYRILVNFDASMFRPSQTQPLKTLLTDVHNIEVLQDILNQIYMHTGVWNFAVFETLLDTIVD